MRWTRAGVARRCLAELLGQTKRRSLISLRRSRLGRPAPIPQTRQLAPQTTASRPDMRTVHKPLFARPARRRASYGTQTRQRHRSAHRTCWMYGLQPHGLDCRNPRSTRCVAMVRDPGSFAQLGERSDTIPPILLHLRKDAGSQERRTSFPRDHLRVAATDS